MADDEEAARAYLADHGEEAARPPRVAEWTPERAELTNATDRLAEAIGVLVALAGGTPPQLQPRPRPETAIERVRREFRLTRHRQLVKRLLPDEPEPLPPNDPGGEPDVTEVAEGRLCSVDGCDKRIHARRLCSTHYQRDRRRRA